MDVSSAVMLGRLDTETTSGGLIRCHSAPAPVTMPHRPIDLPNLLSLR